MLAALAFVPIEHVSDSFTELNTQNFLPEAMILIDYFEDTWIGRLQLGGKRRVPPFPIPLWNCRQATLNGDPRTTNSLEGWHRGVQGHFGSDHPSIWKFIDILRKEHIIVEARMDKTIAGQKDRTPKKRYKNAHATIQSLTALYERDNLMNYLVGIAQNLII